MPNESTAQQAFPRLSKSELETVERFAACEEREAGETLFGAGEADFDFFVVMSGAVEIVQEISGETREVTVHLPGEFTGDIDMLSGRPSLVSAITREQSRVLRVDADALRKILLEIPAVSDKLLVAFQVRRELLQENEDAGLRVIGGSNSAETLQIREFLHKHNIPASWLDSDSEEAHECLNDMGKSHDDLPLVECSKDKILVQPSLAELAACVGIKKRVLQPEYDLVVIGAGPAGLAASVYASSEGLSTLVVDGLGPGGQAGASSKIENFIGFPAGLSGAELANRAMLQLFKFGGHATAPAKATGLHIENGRRFVRLDDGSEICAESIVIATGARYRRLPIPSCRRFHGKGIYYSATSIEACLCERQHVVVIGGGNSAGQAAMYLSESAKHVTLLVREGSLDDAMSAYLVNRLESCAHIDIRLETETIEVCGGERVEQLRIRHLPTSSEETIPASAVFIFIGAEPNTEWLPELIELDQDKRVQVGAAAGHSSRWRLERDPCALETTCPGVFAAGDVRSGSTPRVGFAAGDGALAVTCIHAYRSTLHED